MRDDARLPWWEAARWLLVMALCLWCAVFSAFAQSVDCNGHAYAVESAYVSDNAWWPTEGTDVCAALDTVQWPGAMVAGSCHSVGVNSWQATYAPSSTVYTWVPYPQGCTFASDDDPPEFSWQNPAHVGQALIVTLCALAMFLGFGAGRHV